MQLLHDSIVQNKINFNKNLDEEIVGNIKSSG